MKKTAEQIEEEKLRSKYPNLIKGPCLLQKRLNKNIKYFDSGDYNMAKAKLPSKSLASSANPTATTAADLSAATPEVSTGDTIPTPDNVPAVRKKALQAMTAAEHGACRLPPGSPTKPVAESALFTGGH
ncbi:unnamed protein product [Schistocephalus solidus]|uniref:cAMP-regulated phosphoprotein 19 n=1 Tax=Schistocephalus solidus TaxID=70667 RepID=A0A183TEJ4_SCHSO|nr:unnamed protein product [Schistocephalus solidus]